MFREHKTLVINVRENAFPGETHITVTPESLPRPFLGCLPSQPLPFFVLLPEWPLYQSLFGPQPLPQPALCFFRLARSWCICFIHFSLSFTFLSALKPSWFLPTRSAVYTPGHCQVAWHYWWLTWWSPGWSLVCPVQYKKMVLPHSLKLVVDKLWNVLYYCVLSRQYQSNLRRGFA